MKLVRYGAPGDEKPGMIDVDGRLRDLSDVTADFGGRTLAANVIDRLVKIDVNELTPVEPPARIGCPLAYVPNFHAIGLNYARHAAETGSKPPREPIVFSKATGCLAGPEDQLVLPDGAEKGDWEVELGVVIGRRAWRVGEDAALDHVAAYCTVNDISERAWQMEGTGQWIKGKSAPGFGPVGPWLVTADEVPDPQALRVTCTLNGETMQDSSTADMIFTVAQLISHLSQFMELLPGDLIATGTPEGVGLARDPQLFLKPGDVMEVEVEGLGRQRTEVIAPQA